MAAQHESGKRSRTPQVRKDLDVLYAPVKAILEV